MGRLIAVLAVALMISAPASAQDKPRVIAVNYALAYIAERLLGDAADVVYPVPEGTDPSFWRPSIAEISAIQTADLILLNGAGFATWTARVSLPRATSVDTSRGLAARFIATEAITHSHGDGGEHSHEGTASYTWLDPKIASEQARAVADAIKARDLDDAARVDERLASLVADLDALDAAARDALAAATDTVFVATHPRYQYLARAYGLTILSLEWEAGAAPTDSQFADLGAMVEESGASVLIWEADPPQEARAAVTQFGLQDAVFPPLAVPPSGVDFLAAYAAGLDAMAAAAARAESG